MRPLRAPTPARTPAAKSQFQRGNSTETEDVAVYCRVRPIGLDESGSEEERCVEVLDDESIRLVPPQSSRAFFNGKTTEHSFKAVFDEGSSQQEVFYQCGEPLVKDLFHGKNGLLFTYGVTGSGKTYTMQGINSDSGIMGRSIDVIFNSIEGLQTSRRFMIESDRLNDFRIRTAAEAKQEELINFKRGQGNGYGGNPNRSKDNSRRVVEETKINDVDQDCVYAVFVSFCEIYNKYIYDLLDESFDNITGKPKLDSKNLREDSHGNMFVYGSTEKEVRSAKEALDLFEKGQKKRRVAQTQLNYESSRSHSIFTIRLVKCSPSSSDAIEIDVNRPCVVSQLSLVDLAGSERTARTGNTGERLREAGNINNSLMNLRVCIEKLRENQKYNRRGNVPYRTDKLTHLFRNFFEGIGSVKMIVTVNPRAADYEETMNVLQFAEMTQEVQIERFDPQQRLFAMTPSRQRAQQAYEEALTRAETDVDVENMNPSYAPIYSLGPAFPSMEFTGNEDDETLMNLQRFLEQRFATRNTLIQDHKEKSEHFRQRLVNMEKECILLREENKRLRAGWDGDKRRIKDLENRLVNAEAANTSLQRRVDACYENKVALENELDEKELELNHQVKEAKRQVRRLRSQISAGAVENPRRSSGKRSFDEATTEESTDAPARSVGSRIAELEAKSKGGYSKRLRK